MFNVNELEYLNGLVSYYEKECKGKNEREIDSYLDGRLEGDIDGFGVNWISKNVDDMSDEEYERVCNRGYVYVRDRLVDICR